MTRSWSGAAQTGSREYTDDDVKRVLEALPHGRTAAMSLRTFAEILGMEARTMRAILADRDGIDMLMAYSDDLMWAAEFAEEGNAHTWKLRSRALTELERVARRERFAVTMARRQERLFA